MIWSCERMWARKWSRKLYQLQSDSQNNLMDFHNTEGMCENYVRDGCVEYINLIPAWWLFLVFIALTALPFFQLFIWTLIFLLALLTFTILWPYLFHGLIYAATMCAKISNWPFWGPPIETTFCCRDHNGTLEELLCCIFYMYKYN